jgi:hypothetical protein
MLPDARRFTHVRVVVGMERMVPQGTGVAGAYDVRS